MVLDRVSGEFRPHHHGHLQQWRRHRNGPGIDGQPSDCLLLSRDADPDAWKPVRRDAAADYRLEPPGPRDQIHGSGHRGSDPAHHRGQRLLRRYEPPCRELSANGPGWKRVRLDEPEQFYYESELRNRGYYEHTERPAIRGLRPQLRSARPGSLDGHSRDSLWQRRFIVRSFGLRPVSRQRTELC